MGVIPMIRKYQNEGIVLLALLLFVGGFLYQRGMERKLDVSLERSKTAATEITQVKTLQKVWAPKGLKRKAASLRGSVISSKVKTFSLEKNKLNAHFIQLSGKELNALATKIASLPVRIQRFAVTRLGTQYALRCSCTW